eukprot:984327-Rhodomonas_salina.1
MEKFGRSVFSVETPVETGGGRGKGGCSRVQLEQDRPKARKREEDSEGKTPNESCESWELQLDAPCMSCNGRTMSSASIA